MDKLKHEAILYAEDELGICLLSRLVSEFAPKLSITIAQQKRGVHGLNAEIPRACRTANCGYSVFFLADLDRVACATKYFAQLKANCDSPYFIYRLAKREAEAWLLADRRGLAEALRVLVKHIPAKPEEIQDPKEVLLAIVRKSKSRQIKEAVLPEKNSGYKTGRGYNIVLKDFIASQWNVSAARLVSPSLDRAILAIQRCCQR